MDAKEGSRMPAAPWSRSPIATVALQLGAALGLHLVLSLLLALVASPGLVASLGVRPLGAAGPGGVLAAWAALTAGPATGWAALVLARAAVRRHASGFWFAVAAGLVAVGSFGLVLGAGLGSPSGPGPALVVAAWLLVPCAMAIAGLTALVGAWHERPHRAGPPAAP